ncbi:hypothetical protein NOJ28_11410 [Neorhizobium galegae]|uniref:hypothetical protein n=1 Tax=Neorhizobium galegae TaxID=399 RepID=UPI002104458F|nr:hypothetical protein [Neorhizobium galegae]MCQ1766143.1 hypothetical protein [Neorhizobium galegae]MCQ1845057.1 hypothetical protein [Neorhizobium galegae]
MVLRTIGQEELDGFQLDSQNRLYWRGETVVVERRLKLEGYQIILATLATAGTVASGVHPFLESLHFFGF